MLEKAFDDMMKMTGMHALEQAMTGTWMQQMQAISDQMTALGSQMMADMGKSGFEPSMVNGLDPLSLFDRLPQGPEQIQGQIFDAPEDYMFNPMALMTHMMNTSMAMQQAMIAATMEMMTAQQRH